MPPPGTPIYLLPEGVTAVNVQQTINQASIPIIDCQVHPYLEPSNRTMRITKKGSNTVVTLVAGRVDSRWFKSILPVAFEEKGLFQCYFFYFLLKGTDSYHARLQLSQVTLKFLLTMGKLAGLVVSPWF